MFNGKLISVGSILWKVLRQPIAADLTYDQAAEYVLEFLRLIGAPLSYIDKVERLELVSYKTAIPQNLITIRGVRYVGENECELGSGGIAMTYATDIYHMDPEDCNLTEYTYVTQSCVLTASVKEGFIDISYKAIATDEYGYPLIPDNESYSMGLEYYILHRHLEPLWTMGKIQDKVFSYYEQKRHWYLAQASTALTIQGPDHLEAIMNGLNRIIISVNSHENFYRNFGDKERFKQ
jgi:hypothetical protein